MQSKKLQEEIAEMDATQAEATSLRQEEHAAYLKASKDYKDSATAVANAMQVLVCPRLRARRTTWSSVALERCYLLTC